MAWTCIHCDKEATASVLAAQHGLGKCVPEPAKQKPAKRPEGRWPYYVRWLNKVGATVSFGETCIVVVPTDPGITISARHHDFIQALCRVRAAYGRWYAARHGRVHGTGADTWVGIEPPDHLIQKGFLDA